MDYIRAFIVGGLICMVVQIFIEKTKLMPGRIMVGLVVLGTMLGAIDVYDYLVEFSGAGASVPLIGFGNVLVKGVFEAIDKEGFVGVFKGAFSAASVGLCAALVFSYIVGLFMKPKE